MRHLLRSLFMLCVTATAFAVPYDESRIDAILAEWEAWQNRSQPMQSAASAAATGDFFCLHEQVDLTTSSQSGNDIWGWEDPQGNEYAIMGLFDQVVFYNVTRREIIFRHNDPCGQGGIWRDFKTLNGYAYAVTECSGAGRGIRIFDMTNLPDRVRYVGQRATTPFTNWHNIAIDTTSGLIYLASQNNGFRILDPSVNPENPTQRGFGSTGCHDLYVDNDTAWVCEAFDPFWSIWDCTDPDNPVRVRTISVPNPGFVHQIWVSKDRRFAVTTEETAFKTVKVWDIADLDNIQLVGNYLAPSNLAHNAFVGLDDTTVIVAHYESGMAAFDVSNLSNPVEVDRFDTWPATESPGFSGAWGAFPYTSSGKIFGSNVSGDLFIFAPAGIKADTTIGPAPLTVDFEGTGCNATSFAWDFDDGGSASTQDVLYTYNEAGLYSPSLDVTRSNGTFTEELTNFIIAHAETLSVASSEFAADLGQSFVVPVVLAQHIPAIGYTLPFSWGVGGLPVSFDSASTAGLITDGALDSNIVSQSNRAVIDIYSAAPIPPGTHTIVNLHFTMFAVDLGFDTAQFRIEPVDGFDPIFTIDDRTAPLLADNVTARFSLSCCAGSTGDVDCDGSVGLPDLSTLIDNLFITFTDLCCEGEADVNADGQVGLPDLSFLIDNLFVTFSPLPSCL